MNIPAISHSFVWLEHTVLRQEHRSNRCILCSDLVSWCKMKLYSIYFLLLRNVGISLADVSSEAPTNIFCLNYCDWHS